MGRRAKNKQGAPEPLEKAELKSKKQLGKRKADIDDPETDKNPSTRPAKKVKNHNGKGKEKALPSKKSSKISSQKIVVDENDDSEGWEDEDDLPGKTKYVVI